MTVATREKCPCCDFDSDGFGKNIIGKGYGSCEIRLYRATKYDFYIYSYSVGAETLLKDWFEIYSQKVRFCPVCGRRLAIDSEEEATMSVLPSRNWKKALYTAGMSLLC